MNVPDDSIHSILSVVLRILARRADQELDEQPPEFALPTDYTHGYADAVRDIRADLTDALERDSFCSTLYVLSTRGGTYTFLPVPALLAHPGPRPPVQPPDHAPAP